MPARMTANTIPTPGPSAAFLEGLRLIETIYKEYGRAWIAREIGTKASVIADWYAGKRTPLPKHVDGLLDLMLSAYPSGSRRAEECIAAARESG